MEIHILGIRHHGVGSAKNVLARLEAIQPDLVMIEGPPEIDDVLNYIGHHELQPPVAIMAYEKGTPLTSTFYPFGEYSPEWVAALYANEHGVPVRAIDLPLKYSFQMNRNAMSPDKDDFPMPPIQRDPISYLAEAAGFRRSDDWWDNFFEQRIDGTDSENYFEAVMLAMSTLRDEGMPSHLDRENRYREAYMRQLIRQAETELFTNVVIICGAWHAPSLLDAHDKAKEDKKILKELPRSKIKIVSTWIPWTNNRLSMQSGYGAGITSPGWYEHQWKSEDDVEIRWLTKVAEIFRSHKIDISTAHVIEAYHLSKTLAAMRNKAYITLDEIEESIVSVMCIGDRLLLEMIRKELTVGHRLGTVPEEIPKVPLQEDFETNLKTLRLKLSAEKKQVDLDLRKEKNLAKSVLFHRLEILSIPWATPVMSRSKGTFKESWMLEWEPTMMISLIDKAYLGNTLYLAAEAVLKQEAQSNNKIAEIASMVNQALPAEMFTTISFLLQRINNLTSISADIQDLMKSIPQLIDASRYGSVRNHDAEVLDEIVDNLFKKVCIGLPNACYGIDEESSNSLFDLISSVNESIRLLEDTEVTKVWLDTLTILVNKDGIHHIIRGCTTRLLLDAERFTSEEASIRLSRELSVANDSKDVATWVEGFLRGSGMILIYDHRLWNLLFTWVKSLNKSTFDELLPYLRRAFSKFEYGERRQIGEKARYGLVEETYLNADTDTEWDKDLGKKILPILDYLIGNSPKE